MTTDARSGPRRSRVLPAVVVAMFALVVLADLLAIVVHGGRGGIVGGDGLEVSFRPVGDSVERVWLPVAANGGLSAGDGSVLVGWDDGRITVRAPGELALRFRVRDAGATMELDFRFVAPAGRGRCEVAVGRVVNHHGVDVVRRARLAAAKRPRGTFRHPLADHVGWFEVVVRVDEAAAREGFEVALPRVVRG